MSALDAAMARARAYDVLADILLDGPTPATRARLDGAPAELTAPLAGRSDADLAADHFALFGLDVAASESAFTSTDGLAGGAAADACARLYAAHGFTPRRRVPGSDHVSAQLELAAFLLLSEIEWERHAEHAEADGWRRAQATLLDAHLLRWAPQLAHAIRRHRDPFYAVVADLLVAVLLDHRTALLAAAPPPAADAEATAASALDDARTLLAAPKTSLADLARLLTTPARSGLVLTRTELARLARPLQLPRGFGERAVELENLLRSAARYDALPALSRELLAVIDDWQSAYAALAPELALELVPAARLWLDRLAGARLVATRLGEPLPPDMTSDA